MALNIDELKIKDVSYFKSKYNDNIFVIIFSIHDFQYAMQSNASEAGVVSPSRVSHYSPSHTCEYCTDVGYDCLGLTVHKEVLFQRLIEHPSIRFEWLYINHV